MRPDELARLSEEDFRDLVDNEVRGEVSDETIESLRNPVGHPEITERWRSVLTAMKKNVEGQIGSKRSDLARLHAQNIPPQRIREATADFHRWRAGALRFRSGVDDRLAELQDQKVRDTIPRLTTLVEAIESHRLKTLAEYDASEADLALWDTLDNLKHDATRENGQETPMAVKTKTQ